MLAAVVSVLAAAHLPAEATAAHRRLQPVPPPVAPPPPPGAPRRDNPDPGVADAAPLGQRALVRLLQLLLLRRQRGGPQQHLNI